MWTAPGRRQKRKYLKLKHEEHEEKLPKKEVIRQKTGDIHCGFKNWCNGAVEYWSDGAWYREKLKEI